MNVKVKSIAILAMSLFVLAVGLKIRSIIRRPPAGVSGTSDATMADVNPAELLKLMTQRGLSRSAAGFILRTKLKVLDETDNSVHFLLTFPDGVTSEETITATAGHTYTPTPAEVAALSQKGGGALHPTLTAKKIGPKETLFTLHYFLLESDLPPEVLQRIRQATPKSSARWTFTFVPRAWAQEQGGDNGTQSVIWNTVELVKSMDVKQFENMEWEKSAKVLDNILTVRDLINSYNEISRWLGEIAELRDCAEHPTNPLTIIASQGDQYNKQVIGSLDDSEMEIQSTAFPKVANIAAGAVTQELPFGTGVLISPIVSANDKAIEQFAEDEIENARKVVVPCDVPMTPGDLRPMQGSLEYTYIFKTGEQEDKRNAEGKFDLNVVEGGLTGEGTAQFTYDYKTFSINPVCRGIAQTIKAKGNVPIKAQAGGTPFGGVIELHFGGDLPVVNTQLVSNGANNCSEQTRTFTQNYGAVCHFDRIDMVHGGTYSSYAQDNGGYGTCRIEISRK
jgi:hypothetical protein